MHTIIGLSCPWRLVAALFSLAGSLLAEGATTIRKTSYHGWNEALIIINGQIEAVIVPAIGRVMQLRFSGENDGPFWENRSLDGKSPASQSSEWGNFGGDKTWPAPQAQWERITGRGWPPPQAFDSLPVDAVVTNQMIILRSKVDPHYGIQTERQITLSEAEAEMQIETRYKKIEGAPVRVAIWVITQLKDPERMWMPVPVNSVFPSGYNKQSDILPANLRFEKGVVSCTRSPKDSTKIGSDSGRLIWAGPKHLVEIDAAREKSGEFPDRGSSAEIYTNPNPNEYIEFELLGPLATLKKGEVIFRKQVYHLSRRDDRPLDDQLKALLEVER